MTEDSKKWLEDFEKWIEDTGKYETETGTEKFETENEIADRRPKIYSVTHCSSAGKWYWTRKFATLFEVQECIKAYWFADHFMDAATCFHDECGGHFYLKNCTLDDLGHHEDTPAHSWTWYTERWMKYI